MTIQNIKDVLSVIAASGREWVAATKNFTGLNYSMNFGGSYSGDINALDNDSGQNTKSSSIPVASKTPSRGRSYRSLTQHEVEKLQLENIRLRALATTDDLTGLNNRRKFFEHLEDHIADLKRMAARRSKLDQDSKRQSDESVLVYVDLYDFRAINNILGHQAGDRALKVISDVFIKQSRRSDFPARIGGDEFAILVANSSMENANVLIERLREAFDKLFMEWNGHRIRLIATIGASIIDTNLSGEDNLALADKAMFAEKEKQRAIYPKADNLETLSKRT